MHPLIDRGINPHSIGDHRNHQWERFLYIRQRYVKIRLSSWEEVLMLVARNMPVLPTAYCG